MEIKILQGSEIIEYLNHLADLRIKVFREYPYLYEGNFDYEKEYLKVYVNSPLAVVVLALDGQKVVGASTGLPLIYADRDFQKPFREKDFNLNEIYYFGESVLEKDYRGKGLGKKLFLEREKFALSLGQFTKITFCAVEREEDHPLKPLDYRILDGFWSSLGYKKRSDLFTFYSWPDLGEKKETLKKMVFWLKEIS